MMAQLDLSLKGDDNKAVDVYCGILYALLWVASERFAVT
jgi:hypothetical protein